MPFDAQGYMSAQLQPRTAVVLVPELQAFFGDGEKAEWTVRGLNSNQLARANEASEKRKKAASVLDALEGGSKSETVKALRQELGFDDGVHPDTSRRISMLCDGSVEPPCPRELAVRLAADYPVTFFSLTNSIMELSGQGAEAAKKPGRSGQTAK
jgi:hypothetical protein